MATRMVFIFIGSVMLLCVSVILPCSQAVWGADVTEDRLTAEAIFDGMIHFEADQGLKDYKVTVVETTDDVETSEVIKVEKEIYFLAPNMQLTLVGGEPKSLQSDASFQTFLSKMFIVKEEDVEINDEDCFKIVATPREFAMEKYTKTYYISKEDFRKVRVESIRSEINCNYIRFVTDYYYDEYTDGESRWTLMSSIKVTAYDEKDKMVFEQLNQFFEYDIDIGLTQKDFEKMLEDYKTYYSEGA